MLPTPLTPQSRGKKRGWNEADESVFKQMRTLMDSAEAERVAVVNEKASNERTRQYLDREKADMEWEKTSMTQSRQALAEERSVIARASQILAQEKAAFAREKKTWQEEKAAILRAKQQCEAEKADLTQQTSGLTIMCETLRNQKNQTLEEMAELQSKCEMEIREAEFDRDIMKVLRDETQGKLEAVAKQMERNMKVVAAERDQFKKEKDEAEAKVLDTELEWHVMKGERDDARAREQEGGKKEDLERSLAKAVVERDVMEKQRNEALSELAKMKQGMKMILGEPPE